MKHFLLSIIITVSLIFITESNTTAVTQTSCDSVYVANSLKSKSNVPTVHTYKNRTIWLGSRGGKFVLVKDKNTNCYIKRYIPNASKII